MLILSELMMMQTPLNPIRKTLNAKRSIQGFSLIEVTFVAMVTVMLVAGVFTSLTFCERFAASTRLFTSARAIVGRNIAAASGVAFTGTTTTPAILSTTSSSGTVCDDDGGSALENIQVLKSGTNVTVSGTLTRIVTNESVYLTGGAPDPQAVVRRITFRVNYTFQGKNYNYSETTLRAMDNL